MSKILILVLILLFSEKMTKVISLKRILVVLIVFLIATSAAHGQLLTDLCRVSTVDATTIIEGDTASVKTTYHFDCDSSDEDVGQVTRMLVTLPFTDLKQVEASDSLGALRVLEGPEYVYVQKGITDSTVGIIFRKGLLLTDRSTEYDLSLEFQTDSLVRTKADFKTLEPGKIINIPKVAIVSTGMTDTTLEINTINYELSIPSTTAFEEVEGESCDISGGSLDCEGMTLQEFKELDVTLKITGEETIFDSFKNIGDKVSGTFKNLFGSITEIFN